jgi:hypothetical protein
MSRWSPPKVVALSTVSRSEGGNIMMAYEASTGHYSGAGTGPNGAVYSDIRRGVNFS